MLPGQDKREHREEESLERHLDILIPGEPPDLPVKLEVVAVKSSTVVPGHRLSHFELPRPGLVVFQEG